MKQRFACEIDMTNFATEMFFQIVGGYSPILANDTRRRKHDQQKHQTNKKSNTRQTLYERTSYQQLHVSQLVDDIGLGAYCIATDVGPKNCVL